MVELGTYDIGNFSSFTKIGEEFKCITTEEEALKLTAEKLKEIEEHLEWELANETDDDEDD